MKVMIVKEVMKGDVSPVARFSNGDVDGDGDGDSDSDGDGPYDYHLWQRQKRPLRG